MPGPQFFETRMGHTFYEGTMPRIAEQLKTLNQNLERLEALGTAIVAKADLALEELAAMKQTIAEDRALIGQLRALKPGDPPAPLFTEPQ